MINSEAKTIGDIAIKIYRHESPRAVVQIAHGMEEHQDRYIDFAEYLVSQGFTVVTASMRGHGSLAAKLGWFDENDGWKRLLQDQINVRISIGKSFGRLPVILVAHSMGSIISRVLLKRYSRLWSKVVLTGYPNYNQAAGLGVLIADILCFTFGSEYHSKLLEDLSTGVFNHAIKHPRTKFDWICADNEVVDRFIQDPLCGFGFTASAYRDLFILDKLMHEVYDCRNIKTALPILLLSGGDDPCVGGSQGRRDSIDTLLRCGFENISSKIYPGMRHEILNERDREVVWRDIVGFMLR